MIGMFHDEGSNSKFLYNFAAGSERAGFSGAGVACDDTTSFIGNEAHSSLAGYWCELINVSTHSKGESLKKATGRWCRIFYTRKHSRLMLN